MLNPAAVKQLDDEPQFVLDVEDFVSITVGMYAVQKDSIRDAGKLVEARGALLANCGRRLLHVAAVLTDAVEVAAALGHASTLETRMELRSKHAVRKFNEIEEQFVHDLVAAGLYTAENLPESWRERKGKREQSTDEALSQQSRLTQSPLPDSSLTDSDEASPEVVRGFDEILAQLRIQCLGEDVLIRGETETNMHTGFKTDAHVQQEGGAD